jgi:hypothetical protein
MSVVGPILEDNINFWANGRQPQFLEKWKMTSIFAEMEDKLNFLNENDLIFCKMGDDLNFLGKWKMTSTF